MQSDMLESSRPEDVMNNENEYGNDLRIKARKVARSALLSKDVTIDIGREVGLSANILAKRLIEKIESQ